MAITFVYYLVCLTLSRLLTCLQVVQKLIERVPADRLSFISAFKGSVFELSTHPYGCRVLQRCFEHLGEEQTRPLMDELHKYIINLMQDQFGVRRRSS
jgi:pumilio RNA-binding family